MTLQEIYTKCKCWMYEKSSSTIYDSYVVEVANKVLAEVYEENNMCRMFKGKVPFIDGIMAHQVSSLTDTIDYEDEYLLDVIPKGIDASFLLDDDMSKMSLFQTEYNNSRVMHQYAVSDEKIAKLTKEAQDAD